ncbi:MAG: hypothetical protein M1830_005532 [Pleopsidium flavum]|nr:MAG: hypothetical protein M1830_005532 [Pleopsidium flavum]
MKIVIVGAGISGISVFTFLKKLLPIPPAHLPPHEILIYESHDASRRAKSAASAGEFSPIGGVLGIAPNGMKVLWDLNPQIAATISALGYPASFFQLRNAYGWLLARFNAMDPNISTQRTIMCSRQAIWDCLRDSISDDAITQKLVKEVSISANGRPRVKFFDDSTVEADLVIGADGVKSIVKRTVTGDGKKDNYPPTYEGLVGVGGFIPSSYLDTEKHKDSMTMTFGPHGFFGYGPVTSADKNSPKTFGPRAFWWSNYELDQLPNTKAIDKDHIRNQLQERHHTWKDPVIRKIISDVELDSIYPTFTTPPLPRWEGNGLVLIGDAAHALQPSSGQGASQALEDAQTLALLLAYHLRHAYDSDSDAMNRALYSTVESTAIRSATKIYCDLRKPRVERITQYAKRIGDLKRKKSVFEEWIMYFFIWLMGMLIPLMGGTWNRSLYGYDVREEVAKAIKAESEGIGEGTD